ncbi:hypothetical protein C8R45DRAFT_437577 [Mycena sanguinolenta]|nr:hypothetical protein C8R45DRAFT_437577 [Mycena sanguinolenta]
MLRVRRDPLRSLRAAHDHALPALPTYPLTRAPSPLTLPAHSVSLARLTLAHASSVCMYAPPVCTHPPRTFVFVFARPCTIQCPPSTYIYTYTIYYLRCTTHPRTLPAALYRSVCVCVCVSTYLPPLLSSPPLPSPLRPIPTSRQILSLLALSISASLHARTFTTPFTSSNLIIIACPPGGSGAGGLDAYICTHTYEKMI